MSSRIEDILQATIDGAPYDKPTSSRIEELLIELKEVIEAGGGGGGGTTNYNLLSNKPKINDTELSGNKTSSDLGLQPAISDLETIRSGASAGATAVQPATMNEALGGKQDNLTFDNSPTNGSNNPVKSGGIYRALGNKVDKETGKGLSTNDFTNEYKSQIEKNTEGIGAVANSGAKNLYKPTNPSASNMEVQFTVNNDGTVSVSGAASPAAAVFRTGNWTCPKSGTYVVSGCPKGGAWAPNPNKYRIRTAVNNTWSGDDTGTGILLSLVEGDVVELQINTAIDYAVSNLVFKPMICTKAEWDISQEFVPYAPTNRELYEMILSLQSGT